MRRILAAVLCLAFAAPALATTAQQERMKTCNAKAAGMKGEDRKAFMSRCLKGEDGTAAPAATAQQQRMKDCNAGAAGKTGAERKKFMSECLKAQ
jgi:hypothetical protein